MRTTLTVDDDVLAELKQLAARTGRSLTAVVDDALRESLRRRSAPARPELDLPAFDGDGLRSGIDLDDTAALLDIMDGVSAAD